MRTAFMAGQVRPEVEKKLDEIAATARETGAALATFSSRRDHARVVPSADRKAAMPLPADTLGADFSRLVALQPFEKAPTTFLFQLARALDALPGVELASLEWSLNIEDPAPAVNVQIALQLPAAPRRHRRRPLPSRRARSDWS